ncbi:MAG: glycerol-3-phosphate 1-O-acyltransferase PlsY [Candidatus Methylacidiphilales bacterium]|nr:glycerol-3-phosphate 1-O-acyltransferase PlsY [Candidatus Methylacidiphilales bacterium]
MQPPVNWSQAAPYFAVLLPALFLCGSIPFGYLAGRARGLDIRQHGSGNIGATNVWRVMGRTWGSAVFLLDFLKGCLPVLAVVWLGRDWTAPEVVPARQWLEVTGALAAILGHNYTPWLGFKGGKGIATSAGVLLPIMPASLGVALVAWIAALAATRYVSVASIISSVALPVASYFLYPGNIPMLVFCCVAAFFGIWRHRSNIQRLRAGTEKRLGQRESATDPKSGPNDSESDENGALRPS